MDSLKPSIGFDFNYEPLIMRLAKNICPFDNFFLSSGKLWIKSIFYDLYGCLTNVKQCTFCLNKLKNLNFVRIKCILCLCKIIIWVRLVCSISIKNSSSFPKIIGVLASWPEKLIIIWKCLLFPFTPQSIFKVYHMLVIAIAIPVICKCYGDRTNENILIFIELLIGAPTHITRTFGA